MPQVIKKEKKLIPFGADAGALPSGCDVRRTNGETNEGERVTRVGVGWGGGRWGGDSCEGARPPPRPRPRPPR